MSSNDASLIIGIAGTFGSGKDTVGKYLAEKHGFLHVSTADIVREESMKRHGTIERHMLLVTANDLRRDHGGGVFVKMSYDRWKEQEEQYSAGAAISGLRATGEAVAIKDRGGVVVFVDAPVEVRYERVQARKRDKESEFTLDQFKEGEAKELESGKGDGEPNILAVKDMADYHLMNDGTLEAFEEQIEGVLTTIQSEV